jgi:uncharacterized protein YndB with AHSA1/START domain
MSKAIHHTLFFPNKPEVVWKYLTKSELMELWLMKNDFQPVVGHNFQFKTNPLPNLNFDGIVYCKVLEIIPNKKLVYSWKGGPQPGEIIMDSIVEWTLTEKNNGTELDVVHSGFKEGFEDVSIFSAMESGWLKNVKEIYQLINKTTYGTTQA